MRPIIAVITESELVRGVSKLLQQFSFESFGSGTNTCCPPLPVHPELCGPFREIHQCELHIILEMPLVLCFMDERCYQLLARLRMFACRQWNDHKTANAPETWMRLRVKLEMRHFLSHYALACACHQSQTVPWISFFFLTVKSMNDFLQFCYSKTRYQHLESFRPGWHHAPRENRWHAHDSKLESYHWLSECSDGWPAASSILAHCMVCQLESGRLVLGRFWMKAWMWKLESKSCGEKKKKKEELHWKVLQCDELVSLTLKVFTSADWWHYKV